MAEQQNTLGDGWVQFRRKTAPVSWSPAVTIRRNGTVALSADFVRQAAIGSCTLANVYLSTDGRRLGMRFHSDDAQGDAFRLAKDGGSAASRRYDNRVLNVQALTKGSPLFAKLTKSPDALRRYQPRLVERGFWVIDLAPCFENTFRSRGEIGSVETGIYRYVLGGEAVYIGRGRLADRFAEPDRKEWQFDRIEYSVLNDAETEGEWEARWLEEFRALHNRWPIYNRIGGLRVTALPSEDRRSG